MRHSAKLDTQRRKNIDSGETFKTRKSSEDSVRLATKNDTQRRTSSENE